MGHFSVVTQKKVLHLIKRYCNDLDIKLVFSSFKIGNLFGVKDPIPGELRSRVVYKFACASCKACYVGETTRREHLVSVRASHIFKHLENSQHCRALIVFSGLFPHFRSRPYRFQLKIKEAFHDSKKTIFFESAITSHKSKIILLILTLPQFIYILLLLV